MVSAFVSRLDLKKSMGNTSNNPISYPFDTIRPKSPPSHAAPLTLSFSHSLSRPEWPKGTKGLQPEVIPSGSPRLHFGTFLAIRHYFWVIP